MPVGMVSVAVMGGRISGVGVRCVFCFLLLLEVVCDCVCFGVCASSRLCFVVNRCGFARC